jgi:hypothetical protein
LLVVKRGTNAGARFLLDQAITAAGHQPNIDIFLDDITASTPSSGASTPNSGLSTSAASPAPRSTVNPWTRLYWPTATSCRSENFD